MKAPVRQAVLQWRKKIITNKSCMVCDTGYQLVSADLHDSESVMTKQSKAKTVVKRAFG